MPSALQKQMKLVGNGVFEESDDIEWKSGVPLIAEIAVGASTRKVDSFCSLFFQRHVGSQRPSAFTKAGIIAPANANKARRLHIKSKTNLRTTNNFPGCSACHQQCFCLDCAPSSIPTFFDLRAFETLFDSMSFRVL